MEGMEGNGQWMDGMEKPGCGQGVPRKDWKMELSRTWHAADLQSYGLVLLRHLELTGGVGHQASRFAEVHVDIFRSMITPILI